MKLQHLGEPKEKEQHHCIYSSMEYDYEGWRVLLLLILLYVVFLVNLESS